jgi:hypothetical protein
MVPGLLTHAHFMMYVCGTLNPRGNIPIHIGLIDPGNGAKVIKARKMQIIQ